MAKGGEGASEQAEGAATRSGKRLRAAISGLLVVCALLAAGLLLTALVEYRNLQRAARAVLHSRATEIASSVTAAVRVQHALRDPQAMQRIMNEHAEEGIGVTIVRPDGRVVASTRPGERRVDGVADVHGELRLRGQHHRWVGGTGGWIELWRPLGRGWRRGPRWRRRWWNKRGWWGKGGPPGARRRGARGPRARRGGPRARPGPTLLRVTVATAVADDLVAPARTTIALSGVVAAILLLLGLGLHRLAASARRNELLLQRQRALSSLGEMAAVLAHEIRTPLAGIKGNAQLLAEQRPDEGAQTIVEEAARLERLVNGLLDYARPQGLALEQLDPDRVAERAARIIAPRAAAEGVALVTDPAGGGACLRADPDRLLQVLVNLLQNAVEAVKDSADKTVAFRVRRSRRGRVSFSVLDRGPGLPEAVERLLRPFYSRKERGTGLGLSVARQIVEQHGGTLALVPREGGGVEARVELPARQEAA